MNNETIPPQISDNNASGRLLKRRNIYLLAGIVVLIILNIIISTSLNSESRHLTGELATKEEKLKAAIVSLVFTIPLLGFILGALLSLIPFRNLKYKEKYLYFSLAAVASIQLLIFLTALRNLLVQQAGT